MSNSSERVRSLIYQAEEYMRSNSTLVEALDVLKKEGGKVRLVVYNKSGHIDCTVELTEKSTDECLKILIREYNECIKNIKEEVNDILDGMIDAYVLEEDNRGEHK